MMARSGPGSGRNLIHYLLTGLYFALLAGIVIPLVEDDPARPAVDSYMSGQAKWFLILSGAALAYAFIQHRLLRWHVTTWPQFAALAVAASCGLALGGLWAGTAPGEGVISQAGILLVLLPLAPIFALPYLIAVLALNFRWDKGFFRPEDEYRS